MQILNYFGISFYIVIKDQFVVSLNITSYRWDTPTMEGGGRGGTVPATFSGTTKANNVGFSDGDEAIRDTMRINDDGSLRILNVNREKHQGIWRCHRRSRGHRGQVEEVNRDGSSLDGGGGGDAKTNQVLVKLSVSSRKPSQANKQNRKRKFFTLA